MRKNMLAALLFGFFACASVASAQISIGWTGPSGFVLNDGTTPVLDGGDAIAQLIFTPTGTPAQPNTSGPLGDNVIWDFGTVSNPSTVNNDFGAGFGFQFDDPTFQAGSVFVRVFEGGADPLTAGTTFHDGFLFSVVDNPVPPQNVDAGLSGSGPGPGGSYILGGTGTHGFEQTVIPEPSVFAMLGLGGMFLMIRRRFVKA